MYFKIPTLQELSDSKVSYRDCIIVNDLIYIDYNSGSIPNHWEEISEEQMMIIAPSWFKEDEEGIELENEKSISQFDKIEALLYELILMQSE